MLIENQISAIIGNYLIEQVIGRMQYEKCLPEFSEELNRYSPQKTKEEHMGFVSILINNRRTKIKTGKFLHRIGFFDNKLSAGCLQKLAEHIDVTLYPNFFEELLSGKDIYKAYLNNVGGGSCMAGCSEKAGKVGLYGMNPERFKLYVCRFGRLSARAIVTTLDNGMRLVDRPYTNANSLLNKPADYALRQGWIYRPDRDSAALYYKGRYLPDEFKKEVFATNIHYVEGKIPYIDTLFYAVRVRDENDVVVPHFLNLFSQDAPCHPCVKGHRNGHEFYLQRTDGCTCDRTRKMFDNGVPPEKIALEGFNEIKRQCPRCGGLCRSDEEWYEVPDYETDVCSNCLEDYYRCEGCGDLVSNDDASYDEDDGSYYCQVCWDGRHFNCADCDCECSRNAEEMFEAVDIDKGEPLPISTNYEHQILPNKLICFECAKEYFECHVCGDLYEHKERLKIVRQGEEDVRVCSYCYENLSEKIIEKVKE